MTRPNICLVGCGKIGALHARLLRPYAGLYFCSRSRKSAYQFQNKFSGRGVFADLDAALESNVDAVVIASPAEFHVGQTVRALEAGKAVLVEKPMCMSAEEVDTIASVLAAADNPLLMVAENYYYKPSLAYLKHLIMAGTAGEIQRVAVEKYIARTVRGWRVDLGALIEGGIHFVALVSDLFNRAPQMVEAVFPRYPGEGPERESVVRLVYEKGVAAELHYSWQTPSLTKGVFQHSYIEGTRGRIVFESNGLYVCPPDRRLPVFPGFRDMLGYGGMMRDFLRCLADRSRQPYSDFARARRDLQIVFDAYGQL